MSDSNRQEITSFAWRTHFFNLQTIKPQSKIH
jgi:hypothetical protein